MPPVALVTVLFVRCDQCSNMTVTLLPISSTKLPELRVESVDCAVQGRALIGELEVFEALEKIHREKAGQSGTTSYEHDVVPPIMKRSIAVYEAGKALIGYITPFFDEIQRVRGHAKHCTHVLLSAVPAVGVQPSRVRYGGLVFALLLANRLLLSFV